jgi:hypothetical protein
MTPTKNIIMKKTLTGIILLFSVWAIYGQHNQRDWGTSGSSSATSNRTNNSSGNKDTSFDRAISNWTNNSAVLRTGEGENNSDTPPVEPDWDAVPVSDGVFVLSLFAIGYFFFQKIRDKMCKSIKVVDLQQ